MYIGAGGRCPHSIARRPMSMYDSISHLIIITIITTRPMAHPASNSSIIRQRQDKPRQTINHRRGYSTSHLSRQNLVNHDDRHPVQLLSNLLYPEHIGINDHSNTGPSSPINPRHCILYDCPSISFAVRVVAMTSPPPSLCPEPAASKSVLRTSTRSYRPSPPSKLIIRCAR